MMRTPVTFSARGDPLEPLGVAGVARAGIALARRVLAHDDAALSAWRGAVAGDALLLFGEAPSLPWVDGVQYLGRDAAAPRLFLPTSLRPSVPADALERALLRHAASLAPPLAILLEPRRVVSVAGALPIVRARLQGWLQERA